jgi:hypothetical protein
MIGPECNLSHKAIKVITTSNKSNSTSSEISSCTNINSLIKLVGKSQRGQKQPSLLKTKNETKPIRALSLIQATLFIELNPGNKHKKQDEKQHSTRGAQ